MINDQLEKAAEADTNRLVKLQRASQAFMMHPTQKDYCEDKQADYEHDILEAAMAFFHGDDWGVRYNNAVDVQEKSGEPITLIINELRVPQWYLFGGSKRRNL